LLDAAKAYAFFLKGSDEKGNRNRFLENLQLLGGKAARQHLVMLLAGRHLEAGLFDRLAGEVDDLFFTYVITREATRDFERNFARWAPELDGPDRDRFGDVLQEQIRTSEEGRRRFDDAVRRLEVGSVQGYRLRYLLAKLTQHIDLLAYGESEGTKWLKRYVGEGFEIEHVFPQNPSPEAKPGVPGPSRRERRQPARESCWSKSRSTPRSGNRAFSRKRSVYLQSQLLLTRALAERPKVGINTRIDAAVARIEPFEEWNGAAVTKRQGMMVDLAREVWSVPGASEAL
ncbi:MAG: HNH endonuclease, partial [Holophagales bacterium]|nr:HNH endonuclease [Holophagales bacterium]